MSLVCMFPKPKIKHKKILNNKKPTADDLCEECDCSFAHNHEVFFGNGCRQLSITHKLQKRLCNVHHDIAHTDREVDLKYKREAQEKFESEYGHEEFMRLFGRNYL